MYCELKYKGARPLLSAMALLLISQYKRFGNEIFSVVVKPAFRRVKTSILVREFKTDQLSCCSSLALSIQAKQFPLSFPQQQLGLDS